MLFTQSAYKTGATADEAQWRFIKIQKISRKNPLNGKMRDIRNVMLVTFLFWDLLEFP